MRRSSGSTKGQRRQLDAGVKKAARDLKETVWRAYKHLSLLGRDNALQEIDLGLVNSSAADIAGGALRQPAPRARRDHRWGRAEQTDQGVAAREQGVDHQGGSRRLLLVAVAAPAAET